MQTARKGQISIEFLFTIVALFSIAIVLATASMQFIEYQKEIHLRNQERKIAEATAGIIGTSSILDQQEAKGKVHFRIPFLKVLGKAGKIPCTVEIRPNFIKVTAYDGSKKIEELVPFVKSAGVSPTSAKSGELLQINYT